MVGIFNSRIFNNAIFNTEVGTVQAVSFGGGSKKRKQRQQPFIRTYRTSAELYVKHDKIYPIRASIFAKIAEYIRIKSGFC